MDNNKKPISKRKAPPPPPKGNKRAVGNQGGRPTVYNPQYAEDLVNYFAEPAMAPYREKVTKTGAVQFVPHIDGLPTFERFAFNIGVDYTTLYKWANDKDEEGKPTKPEFFNAFMRAKELQAHYIASGAMAGSNVSHFAIMYLKNFHNWRDKTEQEVTHGGKIDLGAVDAKLEEAAKIRAERRAELEARGVVGRFNT